MAKMVSPKESLKKTFASKKAGRLPILREGLRKGEDYDRALLTIMIKATLQGLFRKTEEMAEEKRSRKVRNVCVTGINHVVGEKFRREKPKEPIAPKVDIYLALLPGSEKDWGGTREAG